MVQILLLVLMHLSFDLLTVFCSSLDCIHFSLQLQHLGLLLNLLLLKLFDCLFQISLSMFGLNLLPHSESNRGLIKRLVSSDSHFDFISNS